MRGVLSSLTAFLMVAVRSQTALARAIVLVLLGKLIGIAAIKTFLFPDSSSPAVDATAMAARVIGMSASQ